MHGRIRNRYLSNVNRLILLITSTSLPLQASGVQRGVLVGRVIYHAELG